MKILLLTSLLLASATTFGATLHEQTMSVVQEAKEIERIAYRIKYGNAGPNARLNMLKKINTLQQKTQHLEGVVQRQQRRVEQNRRGRGGNDTRRPNRRGGRRG